MVTFIYVLRDPDTNEVRYLGKTRQSLRRRLSKHVSTSAKETTYKAAWLRSLDKPPVIELVDQIEGDGCELEIRWIALLSEAGFRLTNTSPGGEPGWTDEARAAIPRGPLAESTKERISEALQGHPVSESTKTKIREARSRQVIVHSEETRKKIAASLRGSTRSAESRKKMSDAKQAYLQRQREFGS